MRGEVGLQKHRGRSWRRWLSIRCQFFGGFSSTQGVGELERQRIEATGGASCGCAASGGGPAAASRPCAPRSRSGASAAGCAFSGWVASTSVVDRHARHDEETAGVRCGLVERRPRRGECGPRRKRSALGVPRSPAGQTTLIGGAGRCASGGARERVRPVPLMPAGPADKPTRPGSVAGLGVAGNLTCIKPPRPLSRCSALREQGSSSAVGGCVR